jgi:hypothetical protein
MARSGLHKLDAPSYGQDRAGRKWGEPHEGMVHRMARRKVTLSLPGHTVAAAQAAARLAGAPFSTYVARALRNETLRQQLAASPLPEDREWLDMAEADEAAGS